MPGLDRFPVSFKTTFAGHVHRHVVLGVYYMGKYGALGMSRREDLMDKPLVYRVSDKNMTTEQVQIQFKM